MSEKAEKYQAVETEKGIVVRCPHCGNPIGLAVDIADPKQNDAIIQVLIVGGLIHRYLTGYCAICFEPFFWAVNERKLSRLLRGRSPL